MMRSITIFIICIFFLSKSFGQSTFKGHTGFYILGTTDQPIPTADLDKSFVDGAAVRVRWSSLEPLPNVFNWAFLDGEIAKAALANKKVSISVLGTTNWLENLGAQQYYYIDRNPNHSSFGDTLPDYVGWDNVFLNRVILFNQKLAERYAANPTVTYFNSIASFFSRNLPADNILTPNDGWQPIWESFGYHPDTIVAKMKAALDAYMVAFPNTAQWNSMDYQAFEPAATGHARNYISQQFANYGISNYPDRFGVWREDLAGCNPPPTIQPGSQWYPIIQNPCRSGAQMLWNVQDGPDRMNNCGILPNTKSEVMDSAISRGIELGMRYMEIYKIDLEDQSMETAFAAAHVRLHAVIHDECSESTLVSNIPEIPSIVIYPNPNRGVFTLKMQGIVDSEIEMALFDNTGRLVRQQNQAVSEIQMADFSDIPDGIYFLKIKAAKKAFFDKLIICK